MTNPHCSNIYLPRRPDSPLAKGARGLYSLHALPRPCPYRTTRRACHCEERHHPEHLHRPSPRRSNLHVSNFQFCRSDLSRTLSSLRQVFPRSAINCRPTTTCALRGATCRSALNLAHLIRTVTRELFPSNQEGWIEPASPAPRSSALHHPQRHHSCRPRCGLETGCVFRYGLVGYDPPNPDEWLPSLPRIDSPLLL